MVANRQAIDAQGAMERQLEAKSKEIIEHKALTDKLRADVNENKALLEKLREEMTTQNKALSDK